ncbi:hydantoinase/oxoprolinase N-terminal domain-containing protein [Kutzneria albida]|uniref:Hydantoinase/oxoprolinase n=1 Tax=Kutzneria albida DSM 43870 TaxID=1449976 RepID=W5WGK0_9PSEU|nr:hydantoinase/oxoprolinase family protein [Kutzneria albida]AHH99987.1 hypothetical protein KALB_6628 [Kutzneria albida DSM 43870]
MRIGIDVGGTNTDAVLVSDVDTVLASVKTPTTADVTTGVAAAIAAVAGQARGGISAVMIGTTHFTNAVVEARRLTPTAAVRLGLPATAALPPFTDWPDRLREAVGGRWYLAHGGNEYDGTELSALRPEELKRIAAEIAAAGITSVALSSVFSPVTAEQELQAARILTEEVPGLRVSCSHSIGRIGLLERENATILNAALVDLAEHIVTAFGAAIAGCGIQAPLLLSQNDGTLMDVSHARAFPVLTFASGPTNSMRGAAYLSGLADCAVIDVGGTTADIGVLAAGFPREAATAADIGGVRTNFRMPDVLPIGIGGGSLVRGTEVGPDSVGYQLTERALVFGGDTLTATDLAVAAGRADIGDRSLVAHLEQSFVDAALERISLRLAESVDRMRISADPLPVVVVGGGSVLVPDALPGLPDLRRPAHHAVANALGAAIAEVGGEVDRVFQVPDGRRTAVLDEARSEAVARAEAAGAKPGTVRVVEVEEVPLAYLPGGATRIKVKAVGELRRA